MARTFDDCCWHGGVSAALMRPANPKGASPSLDPGHVPISEKNRGGTSSSLENSVGLSCTLGEGGRGLARAGIPGAGSHFGVTTHRSRRGCVSVTGGQHVDDPLPLRGVVALLVKPRMASRPRDIGHWPHDRLARRRALGAPGAPESPAASGAPSPDCGSPPSRVRRQRLAARTAGLLAASIGLSQASAGMRYDLCWTVTAMRHPRRRSPWRAGSRWNGRCITRCFRALCARPPADAHTGLWRHS